MVDRDRDFAVKRAEAAFHSTELERRIKLGRVLHPSPASPAANRGWKDAAAGQLAALGVWPAKPEKSSPRKRTAGN